MHEFPTQLTKDAEGVQRGIKERAEDKYLGDHREICTLLKLKGALYSVSVKATHAITGVK